MLDKPTSFEQAKENVDRVAKDLNKIAHDIVKSKTKEIDEIIKKLNAIESIPDTKIRQIMLQLSCAAYCLGEIKEHSNLKADCATALLKEKKAKAYNIAQGTQNARANEAEIASYSEQTVQILYNNISKLLSTKLEETHRVVSTLNSILIGRLAQSKFNLVKTETEQNFY